jgi:hypothetical protein
MASARLVRHSKPKGVSVDRGVVELEGAGRLAGGPGHSLFLVGSARQLFKASNPPFVSDRQV